MEKAAERARQTKVLDAMAGKTAMHSPGFIILNFPLVVVAEVNPLPQFFSPCFFLLEKCILL
jgi:hypothetical protein